MSIIRTEEFSHAGQTLEVRAVSDEMGSIQIRVLHNNKNATAKNYILSDIDVADAKTEGRDLLAEAMEVARTDIEDGIVSVHLN